ncbi:hypothetical protein ACS30_004314 [Salmonella enterica subsp. enterica serovar Panama]|nr:hypothetical protein [Salmonella enterica subsp. enterica serovar Javiana]EEA8765268.1 hypothetical protein [Salmonella enterica subsp. enterica serovar Panama]EEC0806386.1 hypothetical protein [Salmonella enterica subsp. enterica serovar Panama]EGZ4399930.1 hypothetical protein [Salmonella enterica subsp. enterica serovar Panama]
MIEQLKNILDKCYNDAYEIYNRQDKGYKQKTLDMRRVISSIRNLVYEYIGNIEQDNLRLREQYGYEEPWTKIEQKLPPFDVELLFWNDYRKQFELSGFRSDHPDVSDPDKFRDILLKKYRYTHWQRISNATEFVVL